MPELEWRSRGNRILLDLLVFAAAKPSDLTSFPATALLDTGATVSGIGPAVIAALDLESHAKKLLKSATEERFVDYYLFRIGFEPASINDAYLPSNALPYVFAEVDGFSWGRAADFDVILGMDILRQCDLVLRRGGMCQLSFGA